MRTFDEAISAAHFHKTGHLRGQDLGPLAVDLARGLVTMLVEDMEDKRRLEPTIAAAAYIMGAIKSQQQAADLAGIHRTQLQREVVKIRKRMLCQDDDDLLPAISNLRKARRKKCGGRGTL